ncbi:MAG: glycolate oxidase FAD binding subunit [Halioglobus sp.]|jgi:glycolate oxidase FAD binding subunit
MSETTTPNVDRDCSDEIVAAIQQARSTKKPLCISAGGSKRDLLGRSCDAEEFNIAQHRGIIDYQPRELVITVRAATPITEILATLATQEQTLAFEPPQFGGSATLGGTLACNLSGPARPFAGSVRDMVLGVQLINGVGESLGFGGRVMKNVAGYDVSRLQAGAMGTLGVLTQISIKVLPQPEKQLSLSYEMSAAEAVTVMNERACEAKPLTGAYWVNDQLHLRLAGAATAVNHTAQQWGGDTAADDDTHWSQLRDWTLPFFSGDAPLWRLSHSPTAPVAQTLGDTLIDWAGAQRWVRGEQTPGAVKKIAIAAGGHATLVRGGDRSGEVRLALSPVEQRLQQRLKLAFDPQGVLNPGRLYRWM